VVDISTASQPGYALYWPKSLGSVAINRVSSASSTVIGQTDQGLFIDFPAKTGTYVYKVANLTGAVANNLSGPSVISNISLTAGTVTQTSASVTVSFSTDKLAESQVFYGQGTSLSSQTTLDNSLNQSHTVLIENLKPGTTYSFKLRTVDQTGQNMVESPIQTFTTPQAPVNQSLLEVIINALQGAFSGFNVWINQ
jgi:hypothetical protein